MAKNDVITAERLREVLAYDTVSGEFTRLVTLSSNALAGQMAGCVGGKHGYRVIKIDGIFYMAHRLAWLYVTGEWPPEQIDHINIDKADNSWINLREATQAQNGANSPRRSHNTSGVKGVCWRKDCRKWSAQIKNAGKQIHLGCFDTIESAAAAYAAAAAKYHGEFARVR